MADLVLNAAAVDATSGGDYFNIDSGNVFLEVANNSGSAIVLSISGTGLHLSISDSGQNDLIVNDGQPLVFGPFNPNRFKNPSTTERLDYSSHTDVQVRVWEG